MPKPALSRTTGRSLDSMVRKKLSTGQRFVEGFECLRGLRGGRSFEVRAQVGERPRPP